MTKNEKNKRIEMPQYKIDKKNLTFENAKTFEEFCALKKGIFGKYISLTSIDDLFKKVNVPSSWKIEGHTQKYEYEHASATTDDCNKR